MRPDFGLRYFGNVGFGRFDAHKSFNAVVGGPGGFWYGGGGEYRLRNGWFFQGSLERYRRTGERVFVFEGEVFKLGIPDTISITPIAMTAGYRFARRPAIPYIGGGGGVYWYREDFEFADDSEKVRRQFGSYHGVAGIEWRGSGWWGTAVEVQYTRVPHDFTSGVAEAFGEGSLGGVEARVKFVVGK